MLVIVYSKNYLNSRKKFVKNDFVRAKSLNKTVNLFSNNHSHPSLNLEKLFGTEIYTIRLSRGNRIFFTWKNKSTAILIDIGPHDKYRRY